MAKRSRPSRQERRQQLEQERRRRYLLIGGGAAVIVVAIVALVLIRGIGPTVAGIIEFGPQERGHDASVSYEGEELPPVGGIHSPTWQNCGIYDEPVDSANAVHSMEHGAVWIAYNPDALTDADIESLRDHVRDQSYLLLSPYPELKSPVVMSAWGVQLEVDSADDDRIGDFIDRYRLGPQTPEFGAACDGGTGRPIS
ncbi:MAG: DUF3105 domain-containing protein [Candidatus Promineifilaceae bacterium]|nr:DUF3105 domain-containing protein [Candidatus Promineifilaceae bacterium]